MDEKIDAELVKYLAAFVNSSRIMKLAKKKEDVVMCTALEEMIRDGELRGKAEGIAEGKAKGIAEGKAEGKAEAILELLEELGAVPAELRRRIMGERDLELLRKWHKKAARIGSVAEFQEAVFLPPTV